MHTYTWRDIYRIWKDSFTDECTFNGFINKYFELYAFGVYEARAIYTDIVHLIVPIPANQGF